MENTTTGAGAGVGGAFSTAWARTRPSNSRVLGPTNPAQVTLSTMGLVTLINFLTPMIYQTAFLYWRGQTLGKMALGIKVVTPEGGGLSLGKCIGRPLAEILSGCILLVGYLMVIWDPEKRALHDRLAGTRVIKVSK